MLDNKNNITFYIREVAKRVILEAQYPRDVDPSSVKLTVPYKTGIIATIQDIQDAISKINIDPDIDLSNLVDLKSEQTIEAIKKFQEGLQSLKEPKVDEDVVRLLEFKKLIEEIDIIKNNIQINADNIQINKDNIQANTDNIQTNTDEITIIKNSLGDISNVNVTLDPDTDKNLENILNKMVTLIGNGPVDVDVNYTNPERVPTAIGGVAAGTTFDKVPIQDVITMLLYPYQTPAITQFVTNLKQSYKLGESTGNLITLTWNTSNQNNIKDGSISFFFNNQELPKETFNKQGSKTFTVTPVQLNTQGSINIRMDMLDIKNKKISKTITFTWYNGIYYGNNINEDITPADINGLTGIDANSIGRDYKYPGGGYKYIVFPASWNDPSQFVDPATNFDVPMIKRNNIDITNVNGVTQTYKVFRSVNILNGDITIRIKA